jgi:RNA polymerase sporulation-specific sigma factor
MAVSPEGKRGAAATATSRGGASGGGRQQGSMPRGAAGASPRTGQSPARGRTRWAGRVRGRHFLGKGLPRRVSGPAPPARSGDRSPRARQEPDDEYLVALAKQGAPGACDRVVRRYYGFVRLKASSYFLIGGDSEDLIQEGLVGLYKAIRDYRSDRESSFRNFAELCITRQIITAVKTATRNKHTPLNSYVSFSQTPAAAAEDGEPTMADVLPGSPVHDPVNQVISAEEIQSLVACLTSALSELESQVLSLYLDGRSYEEIAGRLTCDTKTVDNALQRVKRKVGMHLESRAVAQ